MRPCYIRGTENNTNILTTEEKVEFNFVMYENTLSRQAANIVNARHPTRNVTYTRITHNLNKF